MRLREHRAPVLCCEEWPTTGCTVTFLHLGRVSLSWLQRLGVNHVLRQCSEMVKLVSSATTGPAIVERCPSVRPICSVLVLMSTILSEVSADHPSTRVPRDLHLFRLFYSGQ